MKIDVLNEQNATNAHSDLVKHTSMSGFGSESGDEARLARVKGGEKLKRGGHVHAINKLLIADHPLITNMLMCDLLR